MSSRSEEPTARSEAQTAKSQEQEQIEALVGEKPTRGSIRRDWKLLPRLLPYLRPYRKFAVLSVLATIVIAADRTCAWRKPRLSLPGWLRRNNQSIPTMAR